MALKIACGQMEIIAGRPDLNTKKMLELIGLAKNDKVDILLFPELAVPGSMIGDLWEQTDFLKDCETYGRSLPRQRESLLFSVMWPLTGNEKTRTAM